MSVRRLTSLVALVFGLSMAIPAGTVPAGGSFPVSWPWQWHLEWASAAQAVGAPWQVQSKAGTDGHYVSADATKAKGGTGRKPDRVANGLPGYQPFEPKLLHYRATTSKTGTAKSLTTMSSSGGAPQIDVRFPPNNWDSTTLTPQLMARGHDPNNHPNTGLKYRFYIFRAETGEFLKDSDWISATTWTVPSGHLEWGKSYLYTVEVYDDEEVSPEAPVFQFSTPVPQPALTSQLADDTLKGFHPGIGNYTTSATDLEVATVGPDLELTRSYNSLDTRTQQALGRGWTSIIDARAVDYGQTVTVTYPDGQEVAFGRLANGSYQPPSGRFATLKSITGGYELTDKNATVYKFTQAGGKISSVTDANGLSLTFSYNGDGTMSKMTSASGRAISLTWATPAGGNYAHIIEASADPATVWKYTYDNDRLVKVCDAAASCTQYEYQWVSQYANAVHNQAPSSFWRFGDQAGATTAVSNVDANAGVDNATLNNVTLGQPSALDGSGAKSAAFNGTSSYAQLPGKLVLEGSYQTISMWFKTTATNGVLFSYSQDPLSNGTTNGNYTPALYVGGDGKLRGEFWQGEARYPITSGAAVNDGNWHHVSLSANGNMQTLYVDGYAQGSLTGNVSLLPNGACNVYIGAGFLGGDWPNQPWSGQYPARAAYFNGSIAEVSYFGRALSSTVAYDLFNIGKWPRAALTKITQPSGIVSAQVSYDDTTGKVASVIDENGGSWAIGKPTVGGNSNVYVASVLGGKPADYWRLGDAAGMTDAVNEVRGGTATYRGSPTLQSVGPFADSKSVKFNGSSSYVELSRNVPAAGPTTVSLWFNTTGSGVLYSYQNVSMASDLTASGDWTPALYVGTDGKLRGGLWTGAVSNVMTGPVVNDGKWHQAVLTAGPDGQMLYVDGVQVCTNGASVQATNARYAYLGAGKWDGDWPNHNGIAGYFHGSIAEFSYHNAKLTTDQVSVLHKASTQTTPLEITKAAAGVTTIPMPVSTVDVTDPLGKVISYTYDSLKERRLLQQRDSLGKVTRYGYDAGGYNNISHDANGVLTERVHDVRGNVIQSITCQDQAANRCSSEYVTYFPDATTTVLTPDPRNDVPLSKRDGRSSSATDNTYVVNYTYDAKGNQTEVCEPLGLKTTTSYTDGSTIAAVDGGFAPAGLPYKVISPSGATETTTYFKNGDVAKHVDANGKATAFTYDSLGRKKTTTDYTKTFPGGVVTSYTYDAVGRVLTETEQATTNRVTGAKHTSVAVHVYNVDGQVVQEEVRDLTGGDATRIDKTSYDARGRIESKTDSTNETTYFAYDGYGHLTKRTEADGDVTRNTYDGEGQLLNVIAVGLGEPPADVVLKSYSYDPTGRLASETDSTGSVTNYTYTDNGLKAKTTQTDGTNSFVMEDNTYDGAGNLIKQVTRDGATTVTVAFDAAGRKSSQTVDPTGLKRTTTFQYSKDDDLIGETETDSAGTVTGNRQHMYDAEGHQIAQVDYRSSGIVPVGRWKLQGDTTDKSGNSPLSWQGSSSFDGNGYLQSAGPALDTKNSFTVSAWVYLTEGSSYHRIAAANAGQQSAFDLRFQPGNWAFNMHKSDTSNAGAIQVKSTTAPVLNTWVHLAATYDGNSGTMALFVNGNQECTGTMATPIQAVGPMMVGAGWWNGGVVDKWKGDIKDVQFYQRALSSNEIGQVKSGSAPAADESVNRRSSILDDEGLVKSTIDPMGRQTDNVFDEAGRIVQVTGPAVQAETGGNAPVSTRPVTLIGYDTFGGVTHRQDPTGDVTLAAYDGEGRVVSTTLPNYTPPGSSTPISAVTQTAYDAVGQVKTVTDPLGNVTTNSYDKLGNLSKVVAADGGVTTNVHDAEGHLLSTVDPVGAKTTATYDYLDRVVARSVIERSPAATHTTTYTYGFGGWLAQERSPSGVVTSTGYNAAGQQLSTTDGANNVTTYTYDGAGRVARVTSPDGTYSTYTYDLVDRELSRQKYSATGTLLTTESKAYDANGRVVSATDARGTTTAFTYDVLDAPISMKEPISASDSIVTSFGYDVEGKRTRFTDGRGNKFLTSYNVWGLPESRIEPATAAHPNATDRTFTMSYDAAGRVVSQVLPGGVTTTSSYDAVGRLLKQTGAGAEVATTDRTYGYDPAGRMTSISGNTLSYNDRDLLLSMTGPSGNSSYTYTADNRLASRVDAAGTTGYTYDSAGRLSTVDNTGTGARETLAYNNMSQVNKITYGSGGNSRTFSFDSMHRVTQDELKTSSGTTIGKVTYGWDANSNLTSKNSDTYTYDLADRLTSWGGISYLYDKSGNRTQNGSKAFTYDERNRLLGGNGMSYAYSPRGTLHSTASGGVSMSTDADAFGRVMKQFASETGSSSYTYDGLGRVIRPGFAYTGLDNDLATDGTTLYTREPDGDLLGEATGSDKRLAWTDLHTDVIGQFTATGTTLAGSAAYDPMGKVISTSGMIGSLGFQSEWTDALTGRVNMLSRWYNPETGQFDSRDSAENAAVPDSINANRYQYGDGAPLTATDPTGHAARIVKGFAAFKPTPKPVYRPVYHPPRYIAPKFTPQRYQPPRPAFRNPIAAVMAHKAVAAKPKPPKYGGVPKGKAQGLAYDKKSGVFVTSWHRMEKVKGKDGKYLKDKNGKFVKKDMAYYQLLDSKGRPIGKAQRFKDAKGNPLESHAGGIAIIGNTLYVSKDRKILKYEIHRSGKNLKFTTNGASIDMGTVKGANGKQRDFHIDALGLSKDGKSLLVAEYEIKKENIYVAKLDKAELAAGKVNSDKVYNLGTIAQHKQAGHIQGVTTDGDGNLLLSRSHGDNPGYVTKVTGWDTGNPEFTDLKVKGGYIIKPEALAWKGDALWGLSEDIVNGTNGKISEVKY